MANVKITALTNLSGTDAEDRDVFVIDDVSATETKKITVANVITFTGNAHLVGSNLDSFATGANAEDTALQARITANADLSASNDFVTYTRLQANIDLVQDNVASVTVGTAADTETRLNANLDIVQDNVVAAEANVVLVRSNVDSLGSYANTTFSTVSNAESLALEDAALQARITANADTAASNDFVTYTRLNANVDTVQDNVTAQNSYITTNYTTLLLTDSVQDNVASAEANVAAVETRRSDNTFFTYNTGSNVVIDTANVEPSQNNIFSLGAPDKVWKDVFIGPGSLQLGEVTISALAGEGITITGASGDQANVTTPNQGGVANVSAELEGLQSRLSTNVTALTNEDTALQSRLATNVTALTNEDTALQSRLATNVTALTNEDTALQARIAANALVAASNDFATYSRLQANIDLVQDNVASVTVGTAADTETRLNANLDVVQDNVVAAEANVVLVRSNVDSLGSYANTTFSTVANAAALASEIATLSTVDTATGTETRLNANLDITNDNVSSLTTTVDNFGTSSNSNAAALAAEDVALQSRLAANVTAFTNEDAALQSRLATNVTAFTNEDAALQSRLATNVTAFTNEDAALQSRLATNVTALTNEDTALQARLTSNVNTLTTNINTLDANADAIEARRAANLVSAVFTSDVTVSGNLIVTGAQVDLGVQTATIQNNFIELSAELNPGDAPSTDSGLLINRGNKGNVFIGDHLGEDGVIFVRTQTPDTNTTVAIESFMDLHGNNFHAAGDVNLQRVHFGLRASEDTGIILDDAGANINFIADGSYVANVHYDGTINSQNAIIAPKVFAGGVELQANDSATLFSARANDFATYTLINANVDVVQDNVATLTTTVDNFGTSSNANAVALAAEDVALQSRLSTNVTTFSNEDTALQARITANAATAASNDFITYTRLNANVDVVQDNVAQNATDITAVETRRTANIAGAVSTITTGNLTSSRALASDGSGKVAVSDVTSTELGYLDGVTSAIQTQLNAKQATITGAATTIDDTNLTASRALVSDGSGKVAVSAVTSTELGHLDGVTSAIQTQLDAKQATITGAATTIDDTNLTASRALASDGSGKVAVSAVTSTELGYLDGVTSAIQTQLDAKQATITGAATTIDDTNLTASRALVSDGSGKVTVSAVTSTEIGHLDGVTSAIQTQLDGKLATDGNGSSLTNVDATTLDGVDSTSFLRSDTQDSIDDANILRYSTSNSTAVSPSSGTSPAVTNAPFGVVGWHDLFAFMQNYSVTYEEWNGSSWSSATADLDLFAQKENQTKTIATGSTPTKVRWTFNNTAWGLGEYIVIGFTYHTPAASKTVTISSSSDDSTYTQRHQSTTSANADVIFFKIDAYSGDAYLRIEIERNDTNDLKLSYISLLTQRSGDQGKGKEQRLPFNWDKDRNITLNGTLNTHTIPGGTGTFGLTSQIDTVSSNAAAVETRRVANIAGAVSTITTGNLTASRALASDGSGKVAVSAVTSTELGYLDGVTSAIQTQLNAKQATITGAATTIDDTNLTASRALASDGSGKVAVSAVTSTELGYLDGVTSAIQTQLDAKQATITGAATTIDDTNLTASRALVSDGSGKVAVSAITSTELAFLDGLDQNLNSNLVALAAGIAASGAAVFPTGDYGLLDAANAATDAFGFAVADLTIFDMSDTPAGELDAQDLGALT